MKAPLIRRLLDYLPDGGRSMYARHNLLGCGPASDDSGSLVVGSVWDDDVAVWIEAYKDSAFPWIYVKHLAKLHLPFPEFVPCDELGLLLRRAYNMEAGKFKDPEIIQALALTKAAMKWEKSVVESVLSVPGVDVRGACRRIGLSADQVLTYERLFYNVLDRGDDALYILPKIYPAGHVSELFDGFAKTMDIGALLRRCGYRNGLDELIWMIGHSKGKSFYDRALADKTMPNRIEAMTMFNGLVLANNGFGFQNGADAPALAAARGMLNAAKAGGQEADAVAAAAGDLADFGGSIADEVKAFGNAQIEKRSAIIQQRLIEKEERGQIAQAG